MGYRVHYYVDDVGIDTGKFDIMTVEGKFFEETFVGIAGVLAGRTIIIKRLTILTRSHAKMAHVHVVGSCGRMLQNAVVVIVASLIVACEERAPCYGAQSFVGSGIEVFDLEIAFERLSIIALGEMTMANIEGDIEIVGAQSRNVGIVIESFVGVAEHFGALGYAAERPYTVGAKQFAAGIHFESFFDLTGLLETESTLLHDLRRLRRLLVEKKREQFERLVVVAMLEIELRNDGESIAVIEERSEHAYRGQIDRGGEGVEEVGFAAIEIEEPVKVLNVFVAEILACFEFGIQFGTADFGKIDILNFELIEHHAAIGRRDALEREKDGILVAIAHERGCIDKLGHIGT